MKWKVKAEVSGVPISLTIEADSKEQAITTATDSYKVTSISEVNQKEKYQAKRNYLGGENLSGYINKGNNNAKDVRNRRFLK